MTDTPPLKDTLQPGVFSYLFEIDMKESDLSQFYEQVNSICRYVADEESVKGLVLNDRHVEDDGVDALDVISKISARSTKRVIVNVSGKGVTAEGLDERLLKLTEAGIHDIVAVTGDLHEGAVSYVDSVDILRKATAEGAQFFAGAGINPFKYTVNDSYGQYLKMIRKVNAGAEFIVTQIGWDMKKLQELLLFCKMRDINVPVIARLALISQEDGQALSELSLHPGVSVSRAFASQIQREMTNPQQFMATQLRRLSLQIVGCSLLGYNGVQICGLKSAEEMKTVLDTAREMMSEFRSFAEWVQEWQEFHHEVEMCSPPYTFYMFKNLLNFKTILDWEEDFIPTEANFQGTSFSQRMKYNISSMINLEKRDGFGSSMLRHLLSGHAEETDYDLRQSQYVSLHQCPKSLYHGPCGGSRINGDCENGSVPCVHNERISMAAELNELDRLENPNE